MRILGHDEGVPPERCVLCHGLLWNLETLASKAKEALKGYEFSTFLVALSLTPTTKGIEERLIQKYCKAPTTLKDQFKRELGKLLERELGKRVDLEDPDLVIEFSEFGQVNVKTKPIFLLIQYSKECGASRKDFLKSLKRRLIEHYGAERVKFYLKGREDKELEVRKRILGVKLINPRIRKVIRLGKLDGYRVLSVRHVGKGEFMGEMLSRTPVKYEITFKGEARELNNVEVRWKRGDRIVKRKLYNLMPKDGKIILKVDPGFPIQPFFEGSTKPSALDFGIKVKIIGMVLLE